MNSMQRGLTDEKLQFKVAKKDLLQVKYRKSSILWLNMKQSSNEIKSTAKLLQSEHIYI